MPPENRTTGWHGPLERFTPGKTLKVGRNGEIDLPLDPRSPFYFTQDGLQLRVDGDLLALLTGSPVRLGLRDIPSDRIMDSTGTTATVAATQARILTALATANTRIAALEAAAIKARGSVVLVAGVATVLTADVATGDLIQLTNNGVGGTVGIPSAGNIVDGVSFDITSSSLLDTSTIAWMVTSP